MSVPHETKHDPGALPIDGNLNLSMGTFPGYGIEIPEPPKPRDKVKQYIRNVMDALLGKGLGE